ncbi:MULTISPECIES: MFS transporter [Pseudomonas]|uniref:MFS transporter n=1 Tax=Pseudomonas aphyarum TaxID=2942629 RepID=A0ABT5PSE6_9PSED|nr:MFS transporter [Pseudomonas aphyarum]MDD0969006.1 MFS transporter [Pseudomonas aphyarum]MDD1126843.1 MFS transporter [Pseudomonas aphyarum]
MDKKHQLYTYAFFSRASGQIIGAYFVLYLSHVTSNSLLISLLLALPIAVQLTVGHLLGQLTKRLGAAHTCSSGMIFHALSYLVLTLTPSLFLTTTSRLLTGAGSSLGRTVDLLITSVSRHLDLTIEMSKYNAARSFGACLAPVLGSVIILVLPIEPLGYRVIFAFSTLFCLVSLFFLMSFISANHHQITEDAKENGEANSRKLRLSERIFFSDTSFCLILMLMLLTIGNEGFYRTFPLWLTGVSGWKDEYFGIFGAARALLGVAFLFWVSPKINARYKPYLNQLNVAAIALLLMTFVMMQSSSIAVIVVSISLNSLLFAFVTNNLYASFLTSIPRSARGPVFSTYLSLSMIAQAAGPFVVSGLVPDKSHIPLVSGLIMFLTLVGSIRLMYARRSESAYGQ